MTNKEIREALNKAGLRQWELAEMMNISEFTLSRKMRMEFPEDMKQHILEIIRNHMQKGAVTE